MTHDVIERGAWRVPIRTWLPVGEIDAPTMEQLENATRHPDATAPIAVMPDAHVGFGIPIGTVLATAGAVIPNAVGVDIGCGMCAVNTGVRYDGDRMDRRFWSAWAGQVSRDVPTGFASHKRSQPLGDLDRRLRAGHLQSLVRDRAAVQLGTLGGGNHFLEAQRDEDGSIWLMVHSGSRHTGLQIARHYNTLANERSSRRGAHVPKDLAALPLDDRAGQDYLHDMEWATAYALENRMRMMRRMVEALEHATGTAIESRLINIHHNFANAETHFGREMIVHRKGATSAFAGQAGIIPGSMGTSSYIVEGLGNKLSLMSCSHGAGRQMGRRAAKKAITEQEFAASLAGTHSRAARGYIDEAPGVYKDIDEVIERQRDLVRVLHVLRPIITVKGDSKYRDD
jgi:tRNA-splicing ligase RtcB (3'-phosphate/5'-hydroxy nucleic acid ligase)